jgi:hypothetical protein
MPVSARLAADVEELRGYGHNVSVVEDGTRFYVVIKDFQLPESYVPSVTDLMLIADYQYPMSALDMFWTEPHVRCGSSGGFPQAADQFEGHAGRTWQRWSWHYQGWDPATHSLSTHLEVCLDRLIKGS